MIIIISKKLKKYCIFNILNSKNNRYISMSAKNKLILSRLKVLSKKNFKNKTLKRRHKFKKPIRMRKSLKYFNKFLFTWAMWRYQSINFNLYKKNYNYNFWKIAFLNKSRFYFTRKLTLRRVLSKKYSFPRQRLYNIHRHIKSPIQFYQFMESRIDNVLVRLGIVPNIKLARLLLEQRCVFLNFKVCIKKNTIVSSNDSILLKKWFERSLNRDMNFRWFKLNKARLISKSARLENWSINSNLHLPLLKSNICNFYLFSENLQYRYYTLYNLQNLNLFNTASIDFFSNNKFY